MSLRPTAAVAAQRCCEAKVRDLAQQMHDALVFRCRAGVAKAATPRRAGRPDVGPIAPMTSHVH